MSDSSTLCLLLYKISTFFKLHLESFSWEILIYLNHFAVFNVPFKLLIIRNHYLHFNWLRAFATLLSKYFFAALLLCLLLIPL